MDLQILLFLLSIPVAIVIGLACTYVFIRRGLHFIIVPSLSLIDVPENVKAYTQIIYKGQPIQNLASTTIEIRNRGFSCIVDKNLVQPIQIEYDKAINLLEYRILRQSEQRNFSISLNQNLSSIRFDLMNGGESVVLQYIHSGFPTDKMPKVLPIAIENVKRHVVVKGKLTSNKPTLWNVIKKFYMPLLLIGLIVISSVLPGFLSDYAILGMLLLGLVLGLIIACDEVYDMYNKQIFIEKSKK